MNCGTNCLACAHAHKVCPDDRAVLHQRESRMFDALALTLGGGRHPRLLKLIARFWLLIIDHWPRQPTAGPRPRLG
jgi:DNA replication protein DnaC